MPEYKTPGVYIEEISAGPRPVQPSSTTDTGFIAVLTLPTSFIPGKGKAEGMFLPIAEASPLLSWNRALAFRAWRDHWRGPRLIGVAHSCQRTAALPTLPTDIPLDAVVTEKGFFSLSGATR